MNADMKWLDNPEVFRVNQLEAHSDHCYYLDYSDMKKEKNPLFQSLNGQWEFSYSKNVKSRPVEHLERMNYEKNRTSDSGICIILQTLQISV